MADARTGLSQSFREMSDGELLERWCKGFLTDLAIEVAGAELSVRGIQPPPYVAQDAEGGDVDGGEPSDLIEVARSQAFIDLEILDARLRAEGIPTLIVNANTNRMGPQFSNSAGGARLLVPSQHATDALEILGLLKAGAFALGDSGIES